MSDYFVHQQGLCETTNVGKATRIWAFSHVLPGAQIGKECNICDHVFIENDVIIGDRVTVKCGVQLWDGLRVEDDVFIGPNASFANDKSPRSRQYLDQPLMTLIKHGASIGAGATILPGIEIGSYAMVGAGAVVTKSVPPYAVVMGNPAQVAGYVDTATPQASAVDRDLVNQAQDVFYSKVEGVFLKRFLEVLDMRGNLTAVEFDCDLPFVPKRIFHVYDVPSAKIRGEHAHRQCGQMLICTSGSVSIVVDDSKVREEFILDSPKLGLYVPPLVWALQYRFSSDASLMVLASEAYDAEDYIRDYDDFIRVRGSKHHASKNGNKSD